MTLRYRGAEYSTQANQVQLSEEVIGQYRGATATRRVAKDLLTTQTLQTLSAYILDDDPDDDDADADALSKERRPKYIHVPRKPSSYRIVPICVYFVKDSDEEDNADSDEDEPEEQLQQEEDEEEEGEAEEEEAPQEQDES